MTTYTVQVFFHGANQAVTFTASGKARDSISDEMAQVIGDYLLTHNEGLVHHSKRARGYPIEAEGYFHHLSNNEIVAFRRADFGAMSIELLKAGSVNSGTHVFK